MFVQTMIYIYLALCFSMILFNCAYAAVHRNESQLSLYSDSRFRRKIRKQVLQVKNGKQLSAKKIQQISHRCKNEQKLAAWDEELTELSKYDSEAVNCYVQQMRSMFITLSVELRKKNAIQQAHFAYIIKKYDVINVHTCPNIAILMLDMVQSPNLYCRQNALEVLYSLGDIDTVITAVQHVCDGQHFHHEKMLVDGLLTFHGDLNKLISRMMAIRKEQTELLQHVILNTALYGSNRYCEEFLSILQNKQEPDELRFIALRYLGKNKYPPSEQTLQMFLQHQEKQRWEYIAIAASALGSYQSDENILLLKNCLSNPNWYVRHNAAVSLEKYHLPYLELATVYEETDRYAREILRYRIEMDQMQEVTA